ncbi:hypothetical protein J2046_000940 [Rhizobium petrolearium]|uniref:hypothetical protein n=1 Tax=Neorhizobium petrolearium TaxID=515361 RepID=UPI001AE3A72D|nr:hypothetical protein [Neorhizobium petrolearium]MBP1842686.1 hypothetical protein [Neorhizobium petrolearium]
MQPSEPKRFGSSQPNIAKSSGTGENKTRKQPDPATAEINKARKVWDAEGSGKSEDRVADASDAGGQTLPYSVETQADVVGRQTAKGKR